MLGFVAVVYRVGNLLEGLIDGSVTARTRIVIHDAGFDDERAADWQPGPGSLMYDSEAGLAQLQGPGTLQRRLDVGGRRWVVFLQPKSGATSGNLMPVLIVAGSGGIVTLLAAALALAWARSRAHARRLGALSVEQSLVFDNALAGIVQVRRHQIHRCNERFAAILGYTRQELIGRATVELFCSPAGRDDFERRARALQQAGKTMEFELALRARDGREVWCAVHGKSHQFAGQRESIWVIEDLSEQRAHAAQLAAQHAATAAANQELQLSVMRLSEQKRLVELLGTMSTALQSCHSSDEIAELLKKSFEALRKDFAGALYLLDTSTGLLQLCRQWGPQRFEQQGFAPQDCWALRR